MHLVLVRHGESTWNVEGRLQGQTMDIPLTARGHRQAVTAAASVATIVPPGTPVLTSDQLRAWQTAAPIAVALHSTAKTTPLLREQSLGSLEGRLTSELVAEPVPEGVDITEVCWGGGESVAQVHGRCRELLDLVDAMAAEHLVLVGHGDSLRILLAVLDGRGHREVEWRTIGNGEVIERTR